MDLEQDHIFSQLLKQNFNYENEPEKSLEYYTKIAESIILADNSIAVLSDYENNTSKIFAGNLAQQFGISVGEINLESAFEECIFEKIHPDDLLNRNQLEELYFEFIKQIKLEERSFYNTHCVIRIRQSDGNYAFIDHRTFFLNSLPNGTVKLALCLYNVSNYYNEKSVFSGKIIKNTTGEIVEFFDTLSNTNSVLSSREIQILRLIAQGLESKEISNNLNIAFYTVNRHRQNITKKLNAKNILEAISKARSLNII